MKITIVKDRKTSLDVSINWKKSVEEYDLFPTIISIVHNYLPRIHCPPKRDPTRGSGTGEGGGRGIWGPRDNFGDPRDSFGDPTTPLSALGTILGPPPRAILGPQSQFWAPPRLLLGTPKPISGPQSQVWDPKTNFGAPPRPIWGLQMQIWGPKANFRTPNSILGPQSPSRAPPG